MRDRNIVAIIWVSIAGLAFALLMLFAPGCATTTPCPTSTRPCPAVVTCESVCLHGKNLGCSWATPTPDKATCSEVCANAKRSPLPWALECSVKAETCADVDDCNR